MVTKTAIIFHSVEDVVLFVFEGDLSRYDGSYIGSPGETDEIEILIDEFEGLLFDGEGNYKQEPASLFDFRQSLLSESTALICCGQVG